tara:strand:- start:485 stop:1189 length:705 start_codon:yes stop_codon:yes gene_type:complete
MRDTLMSTISEHVDVIENSAFLECRCGACRMTLCDPKIRYRLECLCCDCRQRAFISAHKNKINIVPEDVVSYDRGLDDYYFTNAFVVTDASRELLMFSKLRKGAYNTTAMSVCCGTLMCGIHPVYEGASVSVNADSCKICTPDEMSTQVILFGCDFPKEKCQKIKTRTNIPLLFSVYDQLETEVMKKFLYEVTKPLSEAHKVEGYVTFEELCDGKDIEIDNSFYEESRLGKPKN